MKPSNEELWPLAAAIRNRRDQLSNEYAARLHQLAGYADMTDSALFDVAQHDMDLVATCLEAGDPAPFTHFIETRTSERAASGFEPGILQEALTALEETLLPFVSSPEAAKFVWRMMSQARAIVSRTAAEGARARERDQAQATLRQSEERLRLENAALAAAANAIVITGRDGRIIWVNPAFTALTGYTAQEALDQNPRLLKSGQHDAAFYRDLWDTVLAGHVWQGETINRRKDGSLYTEDQTITPVRNERGEITHFIAIKQDITGRKQVEAALRNSEVLYHSLVENLPQSIFIKDLEGRFTYANERFCAELGLSRDELIGKTDYDIHPPEHAEKYRADDRRIVESGQTVEVVEERQVLGGPSTYVRTTKTPTRDAAGQVNGLLGIFWDVTSQLEMEKAISESLERRTRQVELATQVAQDIAAAPALEELFQRVVTLIKERFGYYHAQIFRHEPALNAVVLVTGYGEAGQKMLAAGHRLALGRGVVGTTAVAGKAVLAADVTQDKDWRPNPSLPDTRGELAVPIKLRDEILGILDVQSDRAGALTTEDQLLLEGLCGQIAIAIEDTRLRQEMQERINEISTMYRAMSREGWQAFRETGRLPGGYLFEERMLKPKPDLWLPEIEQAVKQNATASSASSDSVVTPLSVRGEVIGALGVMGDPTQRLSPDDLELIVSVSEQVSLALESARLFEQTQAAVAENRTLYQLSRAISEANSIHGILDAIVNLAMPEVADRTSLISVNYNDQGEQTGLEVVGFRDLAGEYQRLGVRLPIAALPILNRIGAEPLVISDVNTATDLDPVSRGTLLKFDIIATCLTPLRIGNRLSGILTTSARQPAQFSAYQVRLLNNVADEIAIVLESLRLFEQTQAARQQAESRVREMQILNAMTQKVSGTLDLDSVLDALVNTLTSQMGYTFVAFNLIDEATRMVRTLRATGLARANLGLVRPIDQLQNDIVMDIARKGQIEVLNGWDDRFDRELWEREGHAELVRAFVPLRLREQTIAILEVGAKRDEHPAITSEEVRLLGGLADQVAVAIQNTRLFEEAQQRNAELSALNEIITSAGQTLELKPLLDAVLRRTMQIVNFDGGLITMQNEARGKLERIVRIGLPGNIPDDPAEGLENSLCAVVFSRREMMVIQDLRQGAPIDVSGEIEAGYYSYVGLPIEVRGRTVGTLCGFRKTAGPFDENMLALLRTVSRQLGFAIENARLFEQTQARARREQVLREVTARVRSSTDPDTIMRTLARELGTMLNRPAFVQLASPGSGQTGPWQVPGAGGNPPTREGGK